MKKIFLIIMFIVNIIQGQELKVLGEVLYYIDDSDIIEIETGIDSYSYLGYDVIDTSHIFIVYNYPYGNETNPYLCIYNIREKTYYPVDHLFITDSGINFMYNKKNGYVLYAWKDGLKMFSIYKNDGSIIDTVGNKIKLGISGFLPFWIDERKIGFKDWEDNDIVTKYYTIPDSLFSKD